MDQTNNEVRTQIKITIHHMQLIYAKKLILTLLDWLLQMVQTNNEVSMQIKVTIHHMLLAEKRGWALSDPN